MQAVKKDKLLNMLMVSFACCLLLSFFMIMTLDGQYKEISIALSLLTGIFGLVFIYLKYKQQEDVKLKSVKVAVAVLTLCGLVVFLFGLIDNTVIQSMFVQYDILGLMTVITTVLGIIFLAFTSKTARIFVVHVLEGIS